MKINKKILIGIIFALIIILTTIYLFLPQPEITFSIQSSSVIDDAGFPSLKLDFNSNNAITVNLFNANREISYSEKYYSDQKEIVLPLAQYRENTPLGDYTVQINDKHKNPVYEKTFSFQKIDLTINSIEGQWWKENQNFSLIGVIMNVKNNGDIPMYPFSLELTIDDRSTSAEILPSVILPEETNSVGCYLYIESLTDSEKNCSISLYDKNDLLISEATFSLIPVENVPIQRFNWEYNDKDITLEIPLPQFLHDYYSNLDRPDVNDYGLYVFDPYDELYLSLVKDSILSLVGDIDDIAKINLIASFAQALNYSWDDPTNATVEIPRFPIEILDNNPCDCEDKAIFAGNILNLMGYNVSLLDIPYHMVVGVSIEENLTDYDYYVDRYYYLDTTNKGKVLGQFYGTPKKVTVYPLTSRPLIHHNWKKADGILSNGKVDYVKLKLVVENLGNLAANNIEITGAFYSSDDTDYNQEKTSIFSLQPDEKKQMELQLNVPHGVSTILKTQVYIDDILIEEKESDTTFS